MVTTLEVIDGDFVPTLWRHRDAVFRLHASIGSLNVVVRTARDSHVINNGG